MAKHTAMKLAVLNAQKISVSVCPVIVKSNRWLIKTGNIVNHILFKPAHYPNSTIALTSNTKVRRHRHCYTPPLAAEWGSVFFIPSFCKGGLGWIFLYCFKSPLKFGFEYASTGLHELFAFDDEASNSSLTRNCSPLRKGENNMIISLRC